MSVQILKLEIEKYIPFTPQEENDKEAILKFIDTFDDVLTRKNIFGHFTASAFVVNEDFSKALMLHHNIFGGLCFPGGHADGEWELEKVALREVEEETGIKVKPYKENSIFSINTCPIKTHFKKGKWISAHTHFDILYLFIAKNEDMEKIRILESENSAVKWINLEDTYGDGVVEWIKPITKKIVEKIRRINMREIKKGKVYRHFKGNLYQVIDIVNDSESNYDTEFRKMVVYKALYGEGLTWVRDYDMFNSEVDHEKYPDITQKYRFEEYIRDFKKDGLKAFLGLKFYDGDVSKKLVDDITNALAKLNIHTFVAVRDIEKYGEVKGLDMANFMPKYTFPQMETSDIMVIEYSEAGAGLGMCADHAYCHGVPLYLIAKRGSKISTTVNSVAEKVIFYDEVSDITEEFRKLIENGELKTNPNTCKF